MCFLMLGVEGGKCDCAKSFRKSWFTLNSEACMMGNDELGWIMLTEVGTYVSFHKNLQQAETTLGTQTWLFLLECGTYAESPFTFSNAIHNHSHVCAAVSPFVAFVGDSFWIVGQGRSNFWSQPSLAQCGLQRMGPCFHLPRLVWGLEGSLVANFDKTWRNHRSIKMVQWFKTYIMSSTMPQLST